MDEWIEHVASDGTRCLKVGYTKNGLTRGLSRAPYT